MKLYNFVVKMPSSNLIVRMISRNCATINFAQGLPLALKVFGSHLFTTTKKERESTWNQLRAKPREKAIEKRRIAYDGLGKIEKSQILDIACFLKGEGMNWVTDILHMLESVGYFHTNIGYLCLSTIEGEKLSEEHERRLWRRDDVLKDLKYIAWHDFPSKSLPCCFQPLELVGLTLHSSCIQQLPGEFCVRFSLLQLFLFTFSLLFIYF